MSAKKKPDVILRKWETSVGAAAAATVSRVCDLVQSQYAN